MSSWEDPEDYRARLDRTVTPGSLLLASTELLEPTFRRTVIYIIEHNESGSLGVVLNRPSETAVHNVLPQWSGLSARPKALFIGGPVKRDSAMCLGILKPGALLRGVDGIRAIEGRTVMVDLDAEPEHIAPIVEGVRVFVGYAGWTTGQLDSELARDDWMVMPSLPADVLSPARADLWGRVLRRQSAPLSMLATHPIELDRN
ncbi:YqgE/AlgH family protein [Hoyosella sp. YIM 151337]|uniref:YqgE/AlgH family protein n=1 Tax=Hoyosella sp. YIM 151337 TaxID=2992742 RepID=UPI0022358477|nr:YqgE/AlgH family protein [Hoyosella sp. YIM 151337]MCW4354809.1 YqgE/AlgH family protein [Hoyosella sp. YIM 151337]